MRWIIGDIHGMLRPLNALLAAVQRRDADARFVFVGDYVNRGPESCGVVNRLLGLDHAIFLRGNHDDIFDLILNGHCYMGWGEPLDVMVAFNTFMNHGLAETFTSYGIDYAELEFLLHHPNPDRLKDIVGVVPEAHREFFRSLRGVVEFDHFFAAHAFWDTDEPDHRPDLAARLAGDARLRHQILWGRYTKAQIERKKRWHRTGYFGHTPVGNYRKTGPPLPVSGPRIVLLDTGLALGPTGRLSAVCADDGTTIQVDRACQIVAAEGGDAANHANTRE